jgi:O-antigen ligase
MIENIIGIVGVIVFLALILFIAKNFVKPPKDPPGDCCNGQKKK